VKEHALKIENEYLENLMSGRKKAEIRCNDRDYQLGDILVFWYQPNLDNGKDIKFKITHIHNGIGMMGSYVVLSLVRVK